MLPLRTLLVALCCAAAVACNGGTEPGWPTPAAATAPARASTASALPRTVIFASERFTRSTGAPVSATRSIDARGYAQVLLHVVNGEADATHRVSSARIAVDGVVIVGPSEFSQQVPSVDVPLSITDIASMNVELEGKPGGVLTISVDAVPATSGTLTPGGGAVFLLGQQVQLVAPAGAVLSPLGITASPVPIATGPALAGSAVELGPTGTTFGAPVQLTLRYDPASLPAGVSTASLHIHWLDGPVWRALPGKLVDAAHHLVASTTTHFTTFAILPDSVRFCPVSDTDFADFNAAVAAVADGGVIAVCSGTFDVSNVALPRGVTIVGEAPRPVLDAGSSPAMFTIAGSTGAVRITGLELRNGANTVSVTGTYGSVEIDHSVLVPTATGPLGFDAGVLVNGASGGGVSVHDDSMAVGDHAVVAKYAGGVTIVNNHIAPMMSTPLWIVQQGQAVIAHNVIRSRGNGAIWSDFGADSTVIVGNTVTNDAATPNNGPGISAGGRFVLVDSNTVLGTGTPSDQTKATTYPWRDGIRLNHNAVGLVRANHISNVGWGVSFDQGTVAAGSDNLIDNVLVAFMGLTITGNAPVMQRNDITNYHAAIGSPGSFGPGVNFRCNWWGATTGPVGVGGLTSAVTPFALGPIAGNQQVSCTP